MAGVAGITLCFSAYGVAQAAVGAVALSGIVDAPLSPEAKVAQMQVRVSKMQADVATIKHAAQVRADAGRTASGTARRGRVGQSRRRIAVATDPEY